MVNVKTFTDSSIIFSLTVILILFLSGNISAKDDHHKKNQKKLT